MIGIYNPSDLQRLFNALEEFVFVLDARGRFLFANQTVLQHINCSLDQLVGTPLATVPSTDLQSLLADGIDAVSTRTQTIHLATQYEHTIPLEMKISASQWQNSDVFICVGRDISDHIPNEHMLLVQRDLAISLSAETQLEQALQHVVEVGMAGTGLDSSGAYLIDRATRSLRLITHTGLPEEFIQATSYYDADAPQTQLVTRGHPVYSRHEFIVPEMDNVRQTAQLRALAVLPIHYRGEVIGCLNFASHTIDVIDLPRRHFLETIASQTGNAIGRLYTEEALRATEETARALLNNPSDSALLIDRENTILAINEIGAHRFGKTPAEMIGTNIMDYLPPDLRQARSIHVARVFQEGKPARFEDNRQGIEFDNIITPLFDRAGDVMRVAIYSRDITASKHNEQTLHKQRTLFEGVADAISLLMATPEYSTVIEKALGILCRAVGSERASIFQNHPHPQTGEPAVSRRYVWVNEPVQIPQRPTDKPDLYRNLRWFHSGENQLYTMLSKGHCISGTADTLPQRERAIVTRFGIRSFLVVPITVRGGFWGMIGFDDRHQTREWSNEEVSALQTMAASIGATIERRENLAKLQHERELADTLRDVGTALTTTLDLDHVFQRLLEGTRRVISYDAANVMLIRDGMTRVVASSNYDKFGLSAAQLQHIQFKVKDSIYLTRIIETQKPVIRTNLQSDPHWIVFPGMEWVVSWLGAPIIVRDEVVGLFSLDSSVPDFYQPEQFALIETVTRLAAAAYENGRLFENIKTLEREKSDMIRIASHDLRSPLARILALVDRLETHLRVHSPDMVEDALRVSDAAHDIERILDDILSLERIEARHRTSQDVDWANLIARVQQLLQLKIEEKRHNVTIEINRDLPTVRADPVRLEHAVFNLLDNAIKYTPDGGDILIRVFVKMYIGVPKVAVEVKDNGLGIPVEFQARLFEPFYRIEEPRTAHISGKGMGLAVVKSAVAYHNGRVYVDSVVGEGSVFGFWVPAASDQQLLQNSESPDADRSANTASNVSNA